MTVDAISYPAPSELAQKDRKDTLAVLGPEFTHSRSRRRSPPASPPGEIKIPGVLRYQACNDSVCFAPTRANTEWTIRSRVDDSSHEARKHEIAKRTVKRGASSSRILRGLGVFVAVFLVRALSAPILR